MEYRVIILKNQEYFKTVYSCKRRKLGYSNYHELIESNNVTFPKKFINSNAITPVSYKLCLVKEYEEDDPKRYITDEYGRNMYLGIIENKWSLLLSEDYQYEEEFYIYSNDHQQYRGPIRDVLKILTRHAYKKSAMKQVILVYNKILIYDEENTDIIFCKCSEDADRLHYELYRASKNIKLNSFIFNGNPTKEIITMVYEKIMNHTNWTHSKVRKQTTFK